MIECLINNEKFHDIQKKKMFYNNSEKVVIELKIHHLKEQNLPMTNYNN